MCFGGLFLGLCLLFALVFLVCLVVVVEWVSLVYRGMIARKGSAFISAVA